MNRSAFAIAAAATALTFASSANAAGPAAAPPRPSDAATPRAPVVLASASVVQVPTPQNVTEQVPPAKKPRAARVTSCRCGEANPR
jgi:hypothetical protein